MKKTSLFFIAIVISLGIIAQTKRIAHRSHSGKNNVSYGFGGDNFGLPPPSKKTADSTSTVQKKVDTIPVVNKVKPKKKKFKSSK